MTTKVYTRNHDDQYAILDVMRWLRANGTRDVDFVIVGLNYQRIEVLFRNDKLELAYTIQFEWTKQ